MADWYEKSALGDLPARAAARWGEREALCVAGDAGARRYTFAEVAAETDRAARALLALGVGPGERVGLWLSNTPAWVFLLFALARVGAVQIPINTRLRAAEIGYVLSQSGSATLLTSAGGPVDLLAVLEDWQPGLREQPPGAISLPEAPALRRVVDVGGPPAGGRGGGRAVQDWAEALAAGRELPDAALAERARGVDPDGPLFIMYTSGTTGFPKGVVHTHNIVRNVEDRANRMAITLNDAILMFLPLFHIFGFGDGPISTLLTGARLVLATAFDAEQCLELIEAERVSVTYGFDTHFQELLAAQGRRPRRVDSLRTAFVVAGMHSSTEVARRANEVFCPTVTGFGMTEVYVGAALSFPDATLEQRCETSGYPAPGYEFRIVDPETGGECPVGTPGEILVRGYGVMEGYYEKPEETAGTIDPEGWLHTGDMGLLRQDGHLRFIGRYKDMLKVGGENVDPMEVESFLATHPAVAQAAVVGVPDARLGEVPVAFVVPRGGAGIDPARVIAHCKGRIAAFKTPRHVFPVEDFPMTSSGKVRKVELREQARAALDRSPAP